VRLLNKDEDEVTIISLQREEVSKGDYLLVEDENNEMIIQVYDISYYNPSGLEEELVRDEVILNNLQGIDKEPNILENVNNLLKDLLLLKCKVRSYKRGKGIPSRSKALIRRLKAEEIENLVNGKAFDSLMIGYFDKNYPFQIPISKLDGSLNLITGKKGSGKSHLAKILISGLLKANAKILIFDLNNEYSGLAYKKNGEPNENYKKIFVLEPGRTLKFSLSYLGLKSLCDILQNILEIPSVSLREFIRIWEILEERKRLSLQDIMSYLKDVKMNEFIKEALVSRIQTLMLSNLFTSEESFKFEDLFNKEEGCALILSLSKINSLVRKMVVELVLSKLTDLLEKDLIPPLFLFAEEAHLYLRETYWDDVVTRMRHYGIFTTFVTNQPRALKEHIFRQLDNIFIFKLLNTSDIEFLASICPIDSHSLSSLVKDLDLGVCLALGKVTNDLPMVISIMDAPFMAMGETKLFFNFVKT